MVSKVAIRRGIAGLITLLWLLSLLFPAMDDWAGLHILFFGWMGMAVGEYSWLANLLVYLVAVMLVLRRQVPPLLLVFGLLLAWTLWVEATRTSVIANEGGIARDIVTWGAGYYLWMWAVAIAAVTAIAVAAMEWRRPVRLGEGEAR